MTLLRALSFLTFLVVHLLLTSCATKQPETQVFRADERQSQLLLQRLSQPIVLSERTVLIDARSPFDFAMSHAPGSVNLSWTDFADTKGPVPGLLKKDLQREVQRLAALGIDRETPVVVASYGSAAHGAGYEKTRGDEGRLAWTLLYLGIQDVQIASLESLGLRFSNLIQPAPRPSKNIWTPVPQKHLVATKKDLLAVAMTKADPTVHIIDVRSEKEFVKRDRKMRYELPDLRAINIPFENFYDKNGRPNIKILEQLKAINIKPEHRIYVISQNGIRSGAVAFALLSMGYVRTSHVLGGWTELLK